MVRRYVVDNGINCKALHEPVKLFSCYGAKVIGITRPGKVTAFNALIKKQKTITFPEKTFDTICSLTTEQKERIFIVRVKLKAESNHRCQTIYAPAQVRIASCKIDLF